MFGFPKTIMYMARHGETDLNDENCYRGWHDVPLNDNGLASAQEIAHFLGFTPLGRVSCSDLCRAIQTAEAISPMYDRNPNLRPLNLGDFAGKSKAKYSKQLEYYTKENPDAVIPNGESTNQFLARFEETFNDYLAEALHSQFPPVLVVHTSNIVAAHILIHGSEVIPEHGDVVEPGGIVAVEWSEEDGPSLRPVLGAVISKDAPEDIPS